MKRAGTIFGVVGSPLLEHGNVNNLAADLKKKATETRRQCQSYGQRLKQRMTQFGLKPDATDRMKTTVATQTLVDRLCSATQAPS